MTVESERLPPGCSDEIDNDEDGFFDLDDLGCADAEDEDERDPLQGQALPQCSDGQDNDEDGWTDYPWDPAAAGSD